MGKTNFWPLFFMSFISCSATHSTIMGVKKVCSEQMTECLFYLEKSPLSLKRRDFGPIRFNEGLSLDLELSSTLKEEIDSYTLDFTPRDMDMASFQTGHKILAKEKQALATIYFPICTEKKMLWDVQMTLLTKDKQKTYHLLWTIEVMK